MRARRGRSTRGLRHVIPEVEWGVHAPYIAAINQLKQEINAVLLVHNYQTPEIFHGVADYTGDSLGLAREAANTDADIIVQCGVHFMAETSKILCPDKTVLIPDLEAGCSLAESITGADVRLLKERYPGVPVVTYVNTSADVKAESDICCTSGNAVRIVESLGVDSVIFLPGQLPRPLRREPDRRGADPVARHLRGARALHRRRVARLPQALAGHPASSLTRSARPTCSPRPTLSARPRA
jgi:quinolinate synthetase A subunit